MRIINKNKKGKKMKITSEKAHFFNEKQKKIKSEIIECLLEVFHEKIFLYQEEFNEETLSDLIMTCLITFFRVIMTNVLISSDVLSFRENIMSEIFRIIRQEVEESIKTHINNKSP